MILPISGKCHPYHSWLVSIRLPMNALTHLDSHRVDVDLLVQIVEKCDSLDDHGVDLVGRELELETRQRVTETKGHSAQVLWVDTAEQRSQLLSDTSVQVLGSRVGKNGDVEGGFDGGSFWWSDGGRIAIDHYLPSLGSETMSISSSFFFFFFLSPSSAPPPVASTRNFDRVSVNRPSWTAVRSSTAVAVDVKREMAWTLSLEGSVY
jgi:hypothetical protein